MYVAVAINYQVMTEISSENKTKQEKKCFISIVAMQEKQRRREFL